MPFKSANLKLIYELMRDAGLSLSATEVARLFRAGQLDHLIRYARKRRAEMNLRTLAIRRIKRSLKDPELHASTRALLELMMATYESELETLSTDIDLRERW